MARIDVTRLIAALVLASASLPAQDVLFTPPVWMDAQDAPDELPAIKKKPSAAFPAELKATTDIGYVLFDAVLDKKGQMLAHRAYATLPNYERALQGGFRTFAWTPARREGSAVNSAFTHAVIFNPASAAAETPEAAPRLLEVALVRFRPPEGAERKDLPRERIVWIEAGVDAAGRITALKDAPPDLLRACQIAAKNWRFAPARRAGVAVAATVRVPFIVVRVDPAEEDPAASRTQPRVLRQQPPVYPHAMRESEMRGEVVVDFIVDIEGRVRNPFAVRSLNPAFDDPAIAAVRAWLFEPGRIGERPVNTHMQVPIVFTLIDSRGGGSDPIRRRKRDLSQLPEELRYDTPPKPRGTVRVVYPYALLKEKITGKATVTFMVETDGRVTDVKVLEATKPEFGRAVQAAVERFVYEPALRNGRAGRAMESFSQEFSLFERIQVHSREDMFMRRREDLNPASIVAEAELDDTPEIISRPPPVFPLTLAGTVKTGEALVELIVDEEGRPCLPRVVSATDEAFGYAATQSAIAWRFSRPMRGGRAVAVRLQIPIRFDEEQDRKK